MLESIILFHHFMNFLFPMNLYADFYKFFKCRLFYKNSRKSAENFEIIELIIDYFFSMIRVIIFIFSTCS